MAEISDEEIINYYKNRNQFQNPPGTYYDILGSPTGKDEAIEVSILNEHRFAFYYWAKWTHNLLTKKNINESPSLVTIDWHNDLGNFNGFEKRMMDKLDLNDLEAVSIFSWRILNPLNDGHILCAVYLNLINNIYVLSKQSIFEAEDEELDKSPIIDKFGNKHFVFIFKSIDKLEEHLQHISNETFFLDIDLDYFIKSNDPCGDDGKILSDDYIDSILDSQRKLFKLIYEKIKGFTIAKEPKWCNGLRNSNHLMDKLNERLFKNSLLTKNAKWNL